VAEEFNLTKQNAPTNQAFVTPVKNMEGKKASIGIINENVRLKKWYIKHGFCEKALQRFDHLPFTVCFLEKELCF
jgi:hypothetical protein